MKIAIIGVGYVGLVTGTCFSEMGNIVHCVDVDSTKVENLKKGIIPIYEPGLEEMVKRNVETGNLFFTTEIREALEKSRICFIAVGTPMGEDGSADLNYVLSVARSIGEYMSHDMIIINKSTVPVGTAQKIKDEIQKKLDERNAYFDFDVVSNPEFLKEGTAIDDCMSPDRVIIGANSESSMKIMSELYAPFLKNRDRIIFMDIPSAEMTKYAANAMLATRISFMNEISQICENVGADVEMVRKGIGSDTRIGYSFLYAGCGYGGSCFPKDIKALIKLANDYGYKPLILEQVEEVNNNQKTVLLNKIIKRFGNDLSCLTFAIWGLSFKPNTDDMREAPAITVINGLTKRGARIKAYDPKAQSAAQEFYLKDNDNVVYFKSKYDALIDADALVLMTEWKEFRSPDFDEISLRLRNSIVFDGRNQYDPQSMRSLGFEYYGIGRG